MRNTSHRLLILALICAPTLVGCGFLRDKLKPDTKAGGGGAVPPGPEKKPNTDDPPETGLAKGPTQASPLGLRGALIGFENCAAVEEHIESRMIARMRREIEQQIAWIAAEEDAEASDEGIHHKGVAKASKAAVLKSEAMDASNNTGADMAQSKTGPDDYTNTNNQVAGVEEPDFVKNTDRHIFHISRGKLRIFKSWPANELSLLSETKLSGRAFELLLDDSGKRLVVLSNPTYDPASATASDARVSRGPFASMIFREKMPHTESAWDYARVDVTSLDITDPTKPVTLHTHRLPGSYHSARRVGTGERMILQAGLSEPAGLSYYDDSIEQYDQMGNYVPKPAAERIATLQRLIARNEEIIRNTTLATWLDSQSFVKVEQNGNKSPILDLGECKNIHAPTVDTAMGLTHIATLDLTTGSLRSNMLLAQVAGIYASPTSLYLTTAYDWWDFERRDVDYTYIHKFDIQKPDSASYLGSGGVMGTLINQFAMDEHEDYLRVATTVQHYCQLGGDEENIEETDVGPGVAMPSPMPAPQFQLQDTNAEKSSCPPPDQRLYSRVTVLGLRDGQLAEVGKTAAMAPNESIYSVRFAQTRGYVVTFRQVDPLFTLDLADPKNPRIVGELKVPGYSTYIHMVDDKTLLTIGRDATLDGQVRGLKLSLFDVSDMAKPTELHTLALKDSFWSEAETNHKAFNFFRSKGLLAIPVTGHQSTKGTTDVWWGEFVSTLKLYKVDAATGIREVGELSMNDIYNSAALRSEEWWFSGASVQRSVIADNFVYAISDLGIRSANLDQLTTPLATVRYPCDRACFEQWWSW